MNAFVHLSLPDEVLVDIEENKLTCDDCGRVYYQESVIDHESGVHIDPFVPKDGCCVDCGSSNLNEGSDPAAFEAELQKYKSSKEELLGFYDHFVSSLFYSLVKF
jgi:hypothetical protein